MHGEKVVDNRFDYAKMYQDYEEAVAQLGADLVSVVVQGESGAPTRDNRVAYVHENRYDELVDLLKAKSFPHKIAVAWVDSIEQGGDYIETFYRRVVQSTSNRSVRSSSRLAQDHLPGMKE